MLKKITAIILILTMLISAPTFDYFNINNKAYASAMTFESYIDSKAAEHLLIAALIAAGVTFVDNVEWYDPVLEVWEHENVTLQKVKDYLKDKKNSPVDPNDPQGPKWRDVFENIFKGAVIVGVGTQVAKGVYNLGNEFWQLIKSWVDDNYDEGDNKTYIDNYEKINGYYVQKIVEYPVNSGDQLVATYIKINGSTKRTQLFVKYIRPAGELIQFDIINVTNTYVSAYIKYKDYGLIYTDSLNAPHQIEINQNFEVDYKYNIIGASNIVDNPNYDLKNKYTGKKTIVIPLQKDEIGNLKKDENGNYIPSIDLGHWIEVQPEEIPNLDPRGIPIIIDEPTMPEIENPDNDEKTGILIYIANVLQTVVGQLGKILEQVSQIVLNTNQIIFGTPNPVFDPSTGQQIDPETGEPILEPEPGPQTETQPAGPDIDTNIPTDFDWGDFKHFFDIFFIFIYFIVILILILLKFLQVVFSGLPYIASNSDLFANYPEILQGVNYVKNLKVGGLTITVQQAFEFIFMIFFYIFVIKQIRKLYNAYVYEESSIDNNYKKDMKMDYYDKAQKNNSNNVSAFDDAYKNPSNYSNINIKDYTRGDKK